MTHTTEIERGDDTVNVEVSYTLFRACRGHRDKYGCPEEPDEPASIEIESAKNLSSDEEIELTESEQDKIKEEIWDLEAEKYADFKED